MAGTCDLSTSVKRALLVGCNYKGTKYPLDGCVNDTTRWSKLLVDCFDFSEDNITILTDEHASGPNRASKDGIKDTLNSLVEKSKPGDILFFQFSGHGTQTPDQEGGDEADGKDEVILAADGVYVLDDELRVIFSKLESGVKFTMVCDSCHSGTILDKAELIIDGDTAEGHRSDNGGTKTRGPDSDHSNRGLEKLAPGDRLRGIPASMLKNRGQSTTTGNVTVCKTTGGAQTNLGKGTLITGCRSNETSAEVVLVANNENVGLLSFLATYVIREEFEKEKIIMTNRELVLKVNSLIVAYCFKQHVRLEGLRDEADAKFILW